MKRVLCFIILFVLSIGCQDLSLPTAEQTVTIKSEKPFTYRFIEVDDARFGVDQDGISLRETNQAYKPNVSIDHEVKVTLLDGENVEIKAPCYNVSLREGETIIVGTYQGRAVLEARSKRPIPPCPYREGV